MIIHFELCDHCEAVSHGGRLCSYQIEGGPVLHICEPCQAKPFRKVGQSQRGQQVLSVLRMALEGGSA